MESLNSENKNQENLKKKQEKAKEILKRLNDQFEKEKDSIAVDKDPKFRPLLKVRSRIPVSISPEVKKELRQKKNTNEKAKVNLIVDFKEPTARRAKIVISKEKVKMKKGKKKVLDVRDPETPTSLASPSMKIEEPLNKDVLLNKMKRNRNIRSRRRSKRK